VGFQLGAGTEHEVASSAVVEHLAQWRERTQAAAVAAHAAMAACRILSVDAADDGRLELFSLFEIVGVLAPSTTH
jgi:hypothetical protein